MQKHSSGAQEAMLMAGKEVKGKDRTTPSRASGSGCGVWTVS